MKITEISRGFRLCGRCPKNKNTGKEGLSLEKRRGGGREKERSNSSLAELLLVKG